MSEYPKNLTAELRDVLGLMCFNTCPIAHALRAAGEDIPHKTEDEQAHVLHWLIGLVLAHGPAWREVAANRLDQLAKTKAGATA